MSSKCFLKVSWESKVIPNFGFCFSGKYGSGEYDHLGFSGFSLILHWAHHIAKFTRSCYKHFAAKCSFKPIVQYHQLIGIESFVSGAVLEGRRHKSEMDSGQSSVEPLFWGLFGWTRNHLR